jgi:Chaperone of endosialidase
MAFINLPANLQDMFQSIYNRIMKLEAAINIKKIAGWDVQDDGFYTTTSNGIRYMKSTGAQAGNIYCQNLDAYSNVGAYSITVFDTGSGIRNGSIYAAGRIDFPDVYTRVISGRTVLVGNSGGSNYLGTSASTERVKHNIQPYAINAHALLELEPVLFNYTLEVDAEQNPEYGFIAEDADRLGLYPLVGYDKEGLPDYFAYEKLPIFLLQVIKEQEQRIQALEAKLSNT